MYMGKREQLPPLSSAQIEIMEVVWTRGQASVGEIWRTLCRKRKVARNTVQTMVARLEEKGWLRHRDDGGAFRYEAVQPRATTVRGLAQRLVKTAFRGSVAGLVMALLQGESLSRDEADRLRELIRRAEARRAPGQERRDRP
jgi:predicted transcriptional regulator